MWQPLKSLGQHLLRISGRTVPWLLGNWRVHALALGVLVALVVAPAVWRAALVSRHSSALPAREAAVTAAGEERGDKPAGPAENAPPVLIKPVDGPVLRGFGQYYSPTYRDYRWHEGIDLGAAPGDPVRAAAAGRVTAVERDTFWGLIVRCEIGPGRVAEYRGLGTASVTVGQEVSAGTPLGTLGPAPPTEAELVPHLHFVLLHDGVPVDPHNYLGR